MPTDLSILAGAALADIDPGGDDHLAAVQEVLTHSPDDSARLLQLAAAEGLTGQLTRNLIRTGRLDSLAPIARALESTYRRIARDNLRRSSALGEFLNDISQEDIPVVVLKGMALLADTYDDPGLRDMSDIDLWIRPRDRERASTRLAHLGYHRIDLYPDVWQRSGVVIDLHADLLGTDRIRTRRFLLSRTTEKLFTATCPVTIQGAPARLLEPADRALFCILHALKHNLGKTVWLIDLHRLTCNWTVGEWELFLTRAEADGQERAVAGVLSFWHLIFPVSLPPDIEHRLSRIQPLPVSRRLFPARVRGIPFPEWTVLLWYRPKPIRWRRVRFLLETLFPRPAILQQIFPARSGWPAWLLYLLRGVQVTGWVLATLPGLITGAPARPSPNRARRHRR